MKRACNDSDCRWRRLFVRFVAAEVARAVPGLSVDKLTVVLADLLDPALANISDKLPSEPSAIIDAIVREVGRLQGARERGK